MKKTTKPYTSLLRRYPEALAVLRFFNNWIGSKCRNKVNTAFIIKNPFFKIVSLLGCQQRTRQETCGKVYNFFLQNFAKPYILFQEISYICGQVLGNWGVAFCKDMNIIILRMEAYVFFIADLHSCLYFLKISAMERLNVTGHYNYSVLPIKTC